MANRLYVSFWDLCLDNMPRERFERRVIGAADDFDDEGTVVQSIAPLQLAELHPGNRLLVVTCNYQLGDKPADNAGLEDRFVLAAESVGLHLIAALSPQESA